MRGSRPLAAGVLVAISSTAMATYNVTVVPAPAVGYQIIGSSLKLDNLGQVVGEADFPGSAEGTYFKEYGNVTEMGSQLANGAYQYVRGVSGQGIIAGYAGPVGGLAVPFVQSGSTPTVLPGASGMDFSASAVNDNGQVVGQSAYTYNESIGSAWIWSGGNYNQISVKSVPLPQSVGVSSINNSGVVAGEVGEQGVFGATAFTWQNGVATILPSLGGSSDAYDINSAGVVAGSSADPSGAVHAVEWSNGKLIDLGSLAGYDRDSAVAVNDSGEIVGDDFSSDYSTSQAFIYENGVLTDLDALIPADGYNILQVYGMNNSGQIVAEGTYDGQFEYMLLTPDSVDNPEAKIVAQIAAVPEPAMITILFGIAVPVALRRRRTRLE